jgi:predicted transcriptional regulator
MNEWKAISGVASAISSQAASAIASCCQSGDGSARISLIFGSKDKPLSEKTVITSLRINRAMRKKVRELAKRWNRTQSWVMQEAIESYVTFHMTKKRIETDADRPGHDDD